MAVHNLDITPFDEGDDDVLTRAEAAAYLRITTRTLDRRVQDGTIPSALVGRVRRFSKRALQDLLRGGSGTPLVTPPPPTPKYRTRMG